MAHRSAFVRTDLNGHSAPVTEGIYSYRVNGEHHAWNPGTVGLLQWAARNNNYKKYKEFSSLVNSGKSETCILKGISAV
jgi:glutamate synthase (NADPH) large chain